jgi:hypothetical protein
MKICIIIVVLRARKEAFRLLAGKQITEQLGRWVITGTTCADPWGGGKRNDEANISYKWGLNFCHSCLLTEGLAKGGGSIDRPPADKILFLKDFCKKESFGG